MGADNNEIIVPQSCIYYLPLHRDISGSFVVLGMTV